MSARIQQPIPRISSAGKKRARSKMLFYQHLLLWFSISILLIIINRATHPDTVWYYAPVLGWGVLVAIHWLLVCNPFKKI